MAPRKPGPVHTPPPSLALPSSPSAAAPPGAGVVDVDEARNGPGAASSSARNASGAPEAQEMSRDTASSKGRSAFELWPREALIDVLVLRDIELRHEADLTHEHLVRICTRYFANRPLPPMPPPRERDREKLRRMEAAVVRIQRAWIAHAAGKRQQKMLARQASDRTCLEDGVVPPPGGQQQEQQQPLASRPTSTQAARELEYPWVAPDVELAKEYAEMNHPRKGGPGGSAFPLFSTTFGRYCVLGGCGEQLDLWDEGQVSEMALFGSGVTNYFKCLKWQAWTTFCLFLLYLPQLILNAFGNGAPVPTNGRFEAVAKTTLGNLMRTLQVQNGIVEIPLCERLTAAYFPASVECTISRARLAMIYTYIDIAACLFLFVSFMWMKQAQKWEDRLLDRHVVTASDFTVKVTNLPPKVTEAALRAHFASVLEVPVADVAIAYDDGELIEQHKLRGILLRRRDYVVNRIRYIKQFQRMGRLGLIGGWFMQRELPKLKEANTLLLQRIAALDTQLGAKHAKTKPLAAFVTFDHQDAFVHALSVYKSASWLCMDAALRFRGCRIRVEPAPEPSLICWENLGVGRLARLRRKAVALVVAGSLIWGSVIFYFLARYYQGQNRGLDAICPDSWSSMSSQAQRTMAEGDHHYLGCYCAPRPFHAQVADRLCTLYLRKQGTATFWTLFASFLVAAVNFAIQQALERAAAYTKAHSLDQQKLEVCRQTFFLKFINTGAVILLLNSQEVQHLLGLRITSSGNFTREFYYTTGLSLLTVMLVNIAVSAAPAILNYLRARKTILRAERGQLTGLITQEQMNQVFMGPEFPVATRAAANLVVFFVCVTYAQSMPLLLLVASVSAFVSFWTDKYLFLRYYRIPPRFGHKLSRGVANIVQLALLLHLLVSIWAYAQDELFPADPASSSPSTPLVRLVDQNTRWTGPALHPYLIKPHIAPLVLTLVVLASALAARHALLACFNALRACFRCLTCYLGPPGHAFDRDPFGSRDIFGDLNIVDVTYTRAVERGLITGLHTYNILLNPRYQAAFAISDRFAERHRHLESIRGHMALPFDGDDSSDNNGEDEDEELPSTIGAGQVVVSYDVEAPPPPQRWSPASASRGRRSPGGGSILVRTPSPNAPPPI